MAEKHDNIPGGDAAFDLFIKYIIQYVALQCGGSPARWTHIPQAARTALADVYAAWYTAYAVTFKPCTKPERAEKNRQHKLADKALRNFINIYLRYHPDVTEEDKRNMGLHIPDSTRTPINPPEEGPDYGVVQLGPRILGIIYRYNQGRKGSKPYGVEGARIYYGVFDTPPQEQEDLPASVWATRCPHAITFREGDRGKRAYFALKWEVRRGGETGESGWSEILSEIIP
jgi:hypothetical protein